MLLPRGDAAGRWRRLGLVAIKTVHTMAFFSIGSFLGYLAYSGLMKRSDRRAVIAGAVVTGEALVYAGNGFRCPLTDWPNGWDPSMLRLPTSTCRAGLNRICRRSPGRSSLERWRCTRETSSNRAVHGSRDVLNAKRLKLAKAVRR